MSNYWSTSLTDCACIPTIFSFAVLCHLFSYKLCTEDLFRSNMLYIFNMVLFMYSLKDSLEVHLHAAYHESGMIVQILCSLF